MLPVTSLDSDHCPEIKGRKSGLCSRLLCLLSQGKEAGLKAQAPSPQQPQLGPPVLIPFSACDCPAPHPAPPVLTWNLDRWQVCGAGHHPSALLSPRHTLSCVLQALSRQQVGALPLPTMTQLPATHCGRLFPRSSPWSVFLSFPARCVPERDSAGSRKPRSRLGSGTSRPWAMGEQAAGTISQLSDEDALASAEPSVLSA